MSLLGRDVHIRAQILVHIRRDYWISCTWSCRLHNVGDEPNQKDGVLETELRSFVRAVCAFNW